MLGRTKLSVSTAEMNAGPGFRAITQEQLAQVGVVTNNITFTASDLLAGIIERNPTAATADLLPTVDQLVGACPELSVGDSFKFLVRMNTAFAETLTTNTGWTLAGTTAIAASSVREYLVTMGATKRSQVYAANTTNASASITGLTDAQMATLQVGQAVSGAGIPAATTLTAINLTNGTVTMSANATATGSLVSLTFSPTATCKGLWTAGI